MSLTEAGQDKGDDQLEFGGWMMSSTTMTIAGREPPWSSAFTFISH
ncbi:hypothetical protein ACIHFD_10090 [Nonomuraea sp. NPDC051941]